MDESGELAQEVELRRAAEEQLRDIRAREENSQQLANMGDYDWHIPTDTNLWSNQLYRIFGYEPQSQNMDYATYMEHCHPDDRDYVTEIHQKSYATGEGFRLTHRIIRKDGEVRYLLCNGVVVVDDEGTAVRMRGTSVDITERTLAEQQRELHAAQVQEERTRRRAALEINDNVVQGLTAALYAIEMGDTNAVTLYVQRALDAARKTIDGLVSLHDDDDEADLLVRSTAPARIAAEQTPPQ